MSDLFQSAYARLRAYLGARVTVHYNAQTYNDTGTVTFMDATWFEIQKDTGERLLIPIQAIRIVKLLAPGAKEEESDVLLRAVGNAVETTQTRRIPK